MSNSVICSSEYGTMTWAIAECDNDPSCEFIHNPGCDNENWKYCPNRSVEGNSQEDGKACSMMKKGKTLKKSQNLKERYF